MLLGKTLMILVLAVSSASERYQETDGPPDSGWQSALKYFKKDVKTSRENLDDNSDSGYSGSHTRVLFLDNVVYVNNRLGSDLDQRGLWGLNLGFEWDKSWVARGVYLQYADFDLEQKFSFLMGFVFPRLETEFPVYFKLNAGLGYFTGDFDSETLSVDYNAYTGVRFFTDSGWLFNIELGSKNYSRLLRKSYMNSVVVSSGLSFLF